MNTSGQLSVVSH